jgi:hypothetical protein
MALSRRVLVVSVLAALAVIALAAGLLAARYGHSVGEGTPMPGLHGWLGDGTPMPAFWGGGL